MRNRAPKTIESSGRSAGLPCAPPPAALASFEPVYGGHVAGGHVAGDWQGPTLAELADRVEHQFGEAPALAGIYTLGFGRDEPLTPGDVHQVCDLLGLPAEDFGIDA